VLLLILTFSVLGSEIQAATHIQQASKSDITSTTHTSFTATFGSPTTSGNTIVIGITYGNTNPIITATDAQGDTFLQAINVYDSGHNQGSAILYAMNIAGGSTTITVQFNSAVAYLALGVHEYSGIAALDVTAGKIGRRSSSLSSGGTTTTASGDLIFASGVEDAIGSGDAFTAGAGFAKRVDLGNAGAYADEDQSQNSAGSIAATWTLSPTSDWIAAMAAFKPAGTGGTGASAAPQISSVSPTSGPAGTSITITGTNFGASQGTSTVTFNGTSQTTFAEAPQGIRFANRVATPTSWSATSIVAPVPSGASTGNVVVTVSDQASNGVGFTATSPAPGITGLSFMSGPAGTSNTITGTNFGVSQGASAVAFNNTVATPTSWSATSIVVPVPSGATTGNVVVTVGGQASNGVSFTVTSSTPSITGLSPTSGPAGTSATIAGTNFDSVQGTSTVTFNGTTATPTSWSATSIIAPVPSGATTGNVIVTVGGQASNGVSFTVTSSAPSITSLSPTSGLAGTSVTITGTNFGASQDTNAVTFNGTAATPTSWSATSIVAPVPSGATAGNVIVTVGGQASNGVSFTVSTSGGGGIPSTLGWYQVPNTAISSICPTYPDLQAIEGCPAVMADWGGGLFDTKRNRFIIHGGGHTGWYGNEIYAIDLNANPIAPVLINDASHGSAISNIGSCPETFSDGTPNARHTYNGLWYLPTQDTYFLYGAGLSPCGNFSDGQWQFSPSSSTWSQQTPSTHPNSKQNGSVPQFAYDSVSDSIYEVEANTGLFWQYSPANVTWTNLASVSACPTDKGTTVIDPVRRLYLCVGGGAFSTVSLNPPYTAKDVSAAAGCSALVDASAPGFTYDPVQKLEVGWVSGNTAYAYNPDTNSCGAISQYTGGPATVQSNGTFGRFQYSPALGLFVVVNDISSNVYTLRLGSSGSGPVISGVTTNSITTTGAIVTWTTDVSATSQVELGTTTSYGTLTPLDSTLVTSHSVMLSGLSAGTLYHYRVRPTNTVGVESMSGDFAFLTNTDSNTETVPPTVSITAPQGGSTVSGTITVSANATDNVSVTQVQFLLDGANLGSAVTTAPYSISWDTTTATNSTHTLSAKAWDPSNNVGTATPVTVVVSNAAISPVQDFQNRCAAPAVIVCQGFDDAAVFTPATWPGSGPYPSSLNTYPAMDTAVYASGGGSMSFTIPGMEGANAGYWRQLFASSLSADPSQARVIGPGSVFYVQFRQRFSPEFLTNVWPQTGGGTTYWKQEIFSNDQSTCGNEELSTVNDNNEGYPLMYSQCGQDIFQVPIGNGDYLNQQGDTSTTGYNCHYQNPTSTTCFMYPANTWVTFYYKVIIGQWGQPNSTIQAWVAVGGQPYQEWINLPDHTLKQDAGLPGYDMATLLPYMTARDANVSAGPTAYTWYDELIVSTQPIPAPTN